MMRSLQRFLARGLMLVAALAAVCMVHSTPASAEQLTAAGTTAVQGEQSDVPPSCPVGGDDTHLSVAGVLGVSSVVGALVPFGRDAAAVGETSLYVVRAPSCPLWQTTPSLIQLRISRR
ncbi:hypothetical protein E1263_21070 [Kribbella antibiotica]|uniref:Secreted protein n=1 Tax=Kribbella antibiotica TaxID=190195 RepID=A0A4R4ZIU2_9ACTN|nr:hypothetical protein [Kribbella antibiotica]TDD58050.1 hypothetical protein E1263_21070 [Kribbella antibiotica]